MVYKCCVVDCRSNYAGEERTTVFSFPKEESLRKIWIRFVNRKELGLTPSSFICIKHFEEKYCRKGKNDKRYQGDHLENIFIKMTIPKFHELRFD